jgi:hypothetical protein
LERWWRSQWENRSSDTGYNRFAIKGKEKGRRELAFSLMETSHAERTVSSFGVYAHEVLDGSRQG